MAFKTYLKRMFKYILTGLPSQSVRAEIVAIDYSNLLEGKTALITGGTSGIGKAIVVAFLKAGANVVLTSRSIENANRAVKEIEANYDYNGLLYGISLNTKQVDTFDKDIRKVLDLPDIDTIDILVNNAGVNKGEDGQSPGEEYDEIMATNLKGYYFLTESVAKFMMNNKVNGNILNIASASSLRPANSPYIISKWGVRGLTLGMAKKYIKYGIVVNGLAPGPTTTPMLSKNSKGNISLPNNPSLRYALPEEIANMAVVLTSQMGRLVVGDTIYMTGGAGVITYDDVNY